MNYPPCPLCKPSPSSLNKEHCRFTCKSCNIEISWYKNGNHFFYIKRDSFFIYINIEKQLIEIINNESKTIHKSNLEYLKPINISKIENWLHRIVNLKVLL